MNILLLGSGGREHALAWKIHQSPHCSTLYVAPGNAGTDSCATNLNISISDFDAIKEACISLQIDMLIIGPEEPLVKGLVDALQSDERLTQLRIIGPNQQAAQLEGSKAYAKAFMARNHIPTAAYREFTSQTYEEGVEYLKQHQMPVVLKADGLAAGKGVIICQNIVEAIAEFEWMIQRSKFGEAGHRVVVEEFLSGIELSVFILTDGKHYVLLPEAKDYKRIGEGDQGLNTGGMGAVSPVPFADAEFMEKVKTRIIQPTVDGLHKEGIEYKGFIFFGLIKVDEEPLVIEYNCRLGDPETEVVIPRIKNDLVELLNATADGSLKDMQLDQDARFVTTIMAVSGGYPNDYEKGYEITGLDHTAEDTIIFHAGTKADGGKVVTSGGRVCCASAFGHTLEDAVKKSRAALSALSFEAMYFRRDIGHEFLN